LNARVIAPVTTRRNHAEYFGTTESRATLGRRLHRAVMDQARFCFVLLVACKGATHTGIDGSISDATADGGGIDAPPAAPTILAVNEAYPLAIAVFNSEVFWVTEGSSGQVRKAPAAGGTPQTLRSQESYPRDLAVGNGIVEPTVFWIAGSLSGQIRQIATTGMGTLSSFPLNDVPYTIALSGNALYAGTLSMLWTKDVGNASPATALEMGFSNGVTAITADSLGVYFGARTATGSWIVAWIERTGGTVHTIYTGTQAIHDIALDGDGGEYAYWIEGNELHQIHRFGGGARILRTYAQDVPAALVAAGGLVFVATNSGVINPSSAIGRITTVDPASANEQVLAKDQPEPVDLAVAGGYAYWANRGLHANEGQIVRIARP
jgi:hypothetical protein